MFQFAWSLLPSVVPSTRKRSVSHVHLIFVVVVVVVDRADTRVSLVWPAELLVI